MAEETTNVVKSISGGSVKLTKEEYDTLVEKAAEKAPVVVNEVIRNVQRVVKTPEVAASDNKVWGLSLFGIGVALTVIGGWRYIIGEKQARSLVWKSPVDA